MKNYQHGLPGGLPLDLNHGRGDPAGGINFSKGMPCGASGSYCMIWLTCINSVCQDFLFLKEGFSKY